MAARRRDVDMVRILVDYGTNVDTQNGEGQTALHIASAEGDEPMVKYFYGVRASAAIADNQGLIWSFSLRFVVTQFFWIFRSNAHAFSS